MRHIVRRIRARRSHTGGVFAAPARFLALLAFVLVAVLAVSAAPSAPPARAAETVQGLFSPVVGAWWRLLKVPGRATEFQVWELRPDGTFVSFGPDMLQDRGRFEAHSGTIDVTSELDRARRGERRYRLRGRDAMTIITGPPLNQVQEWTRVTWPANFDLADVGGRPVPGGIDRMVTRMVSAARVRWRPDAVPERLALQPMKNRDMRATLDLCSPGDGACRRVIITRFKLDVVSYRTKPGRHAVLPPRFMDLAAAVRRARGLGADGRLVRAEIGDGAPHWGLRFAGGKKGAASVRLDGVTGAPVTRDMRVVTADTHRQWDEALANVGRRFDGKARLGSECHPLLTKDTASGLCVSPHPEFLCRLDGGAWQYGACTSRRP
jgi:hypothetical protein